MALPLPGPEIGSSHVIIRKLEHHDDRIVAGLRSTLFNTAARMASTASAWPWKWLAFVRGRERGASAIAGPSRGVSNRPLTSLRERPPVLPKHGRSATSSGSTTEEKIRRTPRATSQLQNPRKRENANKARQAQSMHGGKSVIAQIQDGSAFDTNEGFALLVNVLRATTGSPEDLCLQDVQQPHPHNALAHAWPLLAAHHGPTGSIQLARRLLAEGITLSAPSVVAFIKHTLAAIPAGTTPRIRAQMLGETLETALALARSISPVLFGLVTDVHMRELGTGYTDMCRLVSDAMYAEGLRNSTAWPPEAFDALIRAAARAGRWKDVVGWYVAFRGSDAVAARRAGGRAVEQPTSAVWPYTAMLDARRTMRVDEGSTMAIRTLRHMQEDGVRHFPVAVINRVLEELVQDKAYKAARALWNDLTTEEDNVFDARLDLRSYRLGLELLHESGADRAAIRHNTRRMLTIKLDLTQPREVIHAQHAFAQAIRAALGSGDFCLTYYVMEMFEKRGVPVGDGSVDMLLHGIWKYARRPETDVRWLNAVLGVPAEPSRVNAVEEEMGTDASFDGNPLAFVPDEQGRHLLEQRLQALEADWVAKTGDPPLLQGLQLPLLRPVARLVERPTLFDVSSSQAKDDSAYRQTSTTWHHPREHRAVLDRAALVAHHELLRRCIVASAREAHKEAGWVAFAPHRQRGSLTFRHAMWECRQDMRASRGNRGGSRSGSHV